jgi:hypothetical protein
VGLFRGLKPPANPEQQATARTGESRFFPFDFAQGQNDNQKCKGKDKSKRRSRSLRDDNQKSKGNCSRNCNGKCGVG